MISKIVAFVGLIASVLFFLYPLYELLNQKQDHILIQIIFVVSTVLLITGSIQTGKKIAYHVHDLDLVKKESQSERVVSSFFGFFQLSLLFTLVFFIFFIMMKTFFLRSFAFIIQSMFGSWVDILLSSLILLLLIGSMFVLVKQHVNPKYPDSFLSFWGKQYDQVQRTRKNMINQSRKNTKKLMHTANQFKPPFVH